MVKALFDTVILIDYLNGMPQARTEIARHEDGAISIVSWMEVMVGAPPEAEPATRDFLDGFHLVPIGPDVAEQAVLLRKKHRRLKLPDAIVWASARTEGRLFVTRDADFPKDDPGVRIPYEL
jgi:predicted nucleic acid-binding protein